MSRSHAIYPPSETPCPLHSRPRRRTSAGWLLVLLILGLSPCAEAQMRERYVTQDAGSQRAFVVALDEFHSEDGDRKPRKQPMALVTNAEAMRAAVERHARRTGEKAEVVLYEEGKPRTPFTRRILTKSIAVKLAPDVDAAALAVKLDLVSRGPLSTAPGWHLFETKKTGGAFDAAEALRAEPGVELAEPQLARLRAKRLVPNDPLFASQWHLGDTNSVNVKTVWDTWRGSGVRIGIIDDGIQTAHPDLTVNVDTANDHDWLDGTPDDANPRINLDYHGTSCAGLVAARQNNSIGVSGVAPEATLVGLRLIVDDILSTDAQEAEAMGWRNDLIQVKSNSWGPNDDGMRLEGPGALTQAALANAVQTGRGGLGTIFVWSGGNGRPAGDHSNYDGYANSIYTIAVAGAGSDGVQIFESEYGANLMVTAPSQGSLTTGIVTTDLTGTDGYNNQDPGNNEPADRNYTNSFGGTSASCPMVAGVVALMLQAKPTLGWRDVQEILIRSATKNHPGDGRWANNGAGWHFNDRYGAGLVNAQAAVNLATTWTNLQPQQSITSAQTGLNVAIPDNNSTGITRTFDLSAASLRVERVTVTVNINHTRRGDLGMTLTSPSGMQSILAETHGDTNAHYSNWTFSTVRSWGENAAGNWTLKITDTQGANTGALTGATLTVYGTPRTYTVTTTADSGAGSLRQALADAAASPGPDTITFAAGLSGTTINLTTVGNTGSNSNDKSALHINGDTGGVTIDATPLPGGITLSDNGNSTYRLLKITNSTVTLRGLTFKDGGITTFGNSSGGAIVTSGSTVTIERCTFTGNVGDGGGAIFADHTTAGGSMTLTNCTLAGNYTTSAGANTGDGGAIFNYGGTMSLTHCTVAGNNAPTGQPGAGGIMGYLGTVTLENCIVAGNTATGAPADVRNHSSTLVINGFNIIPASTNAGTLTNNGTILTDDPKLAPLGYYGGPTPTMPPTNTSPAIDPIGGSLTSPYATDQRGMPRVQSFFFRPVTVDIGAVERELAQLTSTVVNTNDSGVGSLRDALQGTSSENNFNVKFDPALNGLTITPATTITINKDVTLDSAGLAISPVISGGGSRRIFQVLANNTLVLQGITLSNGNSSAGGAIHNAGVTILKRCTLSGHRAGSGGAIYNDGFLELTQCTFTDNSLTGTSHGGAIFNTGSLTVRQSTLTENTTPRFTGGLGGAIYNATPASQLTLIDSIVSGNSANNGGQTTGNDIFSFGSVTRQGVNLLQNLVLGGGTGSESGPAAIQAAPQLLRLANHGGPTPTMPPMVGSPALDALTTPPSEIDEDQRKTGFPRVVDGDGDGIARADVGAAEAQVVLVTTAADEQNGGTNGTSLREAIADTSGHADIIRFDAAVFNGQPADVIRLTLSGSNSHLEVWRSLSIDALNLGMNVTISGDANNSGGSNAGDTRIMRVNPFTSVALRGLTLQDGNHPYGGAILNHGTLTLTRCILTGNQANNAAANPDGAGGGAILNGSSLTLNQCALSNNQANNSADGGGGILSSGTLTVNECTFSGNHADNCFGGGGGIYNRGSIFTVHRSTLTDNHANNSTGGGGIYSSNVVEGLINHCTLAGNHATGSSGGGLYTSGPLMVQNSIVAGNFAGSNPNIAGTLGTSVTNLTTGDPLLAPLGNYGGPTQTMALLPGSPARNAATASSLSFATWTPPLTTDQRGFAIVGTPDIGAYEAGSTATNYNSWVYESLPASATTPQRASTFDFDGDGQTNEQEWAALTDPGSTSSAFRVTQSSISGNTFHISIPTVIGRTYQLQSSPGLTGPWTNIGIPATGSGGSVTLPADVTGLTKYFFRVSVSAP